MRVIAAHHITDGGGAFAVGFVVGLAVLVHRVEDAPVHRLQAVAHVRERAADDHAHRVIEIAAPHLVLDRDGRAVIGDAFGALRLVVLAVHAAVQIVVVAHEILPPDPLLRGPVFLSFLARRNISERPLRSNRQWAGIHNL